MRLWFCVVLGVVVAACPSPPSGNDGGVDAGHDVDAGFDAGVPDAGVDAGDPDAGVDGGEPDAGPPVEICGDHLDNDNDGGTDCADLACAADPICAQDAGTCAHCGEACQTQTSCLSGDYHNTTPLPLCTFSVCTAREEFIRVKVALNAGAGWNGLATYPKSGLTRFIKTTALDGTPVTCATLETYTQNNTAANAIEMSGLFNVQGFDIQGISGFTGGALVFNNVNTETGGEYLVWLELWSGAVNGSSWYPNGTRKGHGCLADPGGALVAGDGCDTGSCRAFTVSIPNPD